MIKVFHTGLRCAFATLLGSTALTAVSAQTPTEQAEEQPREEQAKDEAAPDADGEEIVVTARKGFLEQNVTGATRLPIPVKDLPQGLSVVSEGVVQAAQIQDFTELVGYVSGLQTGGSTSGTDVQTSIRGFALSKDYSYLLDGGVYSNRFGLDFSVIDHIEVVKGPSSVVYGSGSPGGAVNIVLKGPTRDPSYGAMLSYGSYNTLRTELDAGGPINRSGSVRYRAIATFDRGNSFQKGVDHRDIALLGGLDFDLTSQTTLGVRMIYQKLKRTPEEYYPIFDSTDGVEGQAERARFVNAPKDFFFGAPWARFGADFYLATATLEHRFDNGIVLTARGNYNKADTLWRNVYIYGRIDPGARSADLFSFILNDNRKSYSGEVSARGKFKLFGQDDNIWYIAADHRKVHQYEPLGQFYGFSPVATIDDVLDFDAVEDLLESIPQPPDMDSGIYDGLIVNTAKTSGLVGQLVLKPVERLTLLLGGRYDKTDSLTLSNFTGGETALSEDCDIARCGRIKANKFLTRIGASYRLTDDVSPYISYSDSYFPTARTTADGRNLPAETGRQLEAGVKASLLDDKLSLTSSVFQIKRTVNAPTSQRNDGFTPVKQQHRGFEIELVGRPMPGLDISTQYSLIDTKAETGDMITDVVVGERPNNVAKHNFGLLGTYELQSGPLKGFGFGGGVRYVSKRFVDLANEFEYGPVTLADAILRYSPSDRYLFQLNVKNIFDKKYFELSSFADATTGHPRGDRRRVTASVTTRF